MKQEPRTTMAFWLLIFAVFLALALSLVASAAFAGDAARPQPTETPPPREPIGPYPATRQLNVPLQQGSGLPVGPSLTQQAAGNWLTFAQENFEGAFPSSGWVVSDYSDDGFERYWGKTDFLRWAGSYSIWAARGGANGLDPWVVNDYPPYLSTWLIYGPVNLSDAKSVQTLFYLWRDIETNYDEFFVGASTDGSSFNGFAWSGYAVWEQETVDFSEVAGQSQVWFGWNFESDVDNGNWQYRGPFVDEILIQKKVNSPPVADAGRDQPDFAIGQWGQLDGRASSDPDGDLLTYTWTVVGWPAGDPDHHNQNLCPVALCDLAPLTFDADDVGTWTIRLTVSDGAASSTDDMNLTVRGLPANGKWPSASETANSGAITGRIGYPSWDFYGLLKYTAFPRVIYKDEEGTPFPDHYLQDPLIQPLLNLQQMAEQEGMLIRITEAWDIQGEHAQNSLHYEGRAMDITPSLPPADPQRISRLAHLATLAGFNWVFNEVDHVHVSARGKNAGAFQWGYHCANCLTHQERFSQPMSGAAVGSMIANWGGVNVDQFQFYAQAGSPPNGLECGTLAGRLNAYLDPPYHFSCGLETVAERAMHIVAYWFDKNVIDHGVGVPGGMPTLGDHLHWMAVEGVIATLRPTDVTPPGDVGGGAYTVGGFFIDDPAISAASSAKRFVTAAEWVATYYMPVGQFYEAMVEPPPDNIRAEIYRPSAHSLPLLKGRTPSTATVLAIQQVMAGYAVEGIEEFRLYGSTSFDAAYDGAVPSAAQVIFVSREDNGADYYLVPFVRGGRITAVVRIDAATGQFMEVVYDPDGLSIPTNPAKTYFWLGPTSGRDAFHPLQLGGGGGKPTPEP
ncbi:MAG TPA: hypothetical protein VJ123_06930 [Anaerolineales bacterium]|nr:hypothetical protein [Anaerolineales bacterium]